MHGSSSVARPGGWQARYEQPAACSHQSRARPLLVILAGSQGSGPKPIGTVIGKMRSCRRLPLMTRDLQSNFQVWAMRRRGALGLGKQMDQQPASVVDDGDGAHSCWWTTATLGTARSLGKDFQHWRRPRVLTLHAAVLASMLPSDDSCPLCEFRCSHNCAQSLKAASAGGAHYISTWV